MSRFADPKATERVVVGDCECPGKPHDEDWIDIRTSYSLMELAVLEGDDPIARWKIVIAGWNLIGDDGPAPVDDEYLNRLDMPTVLAVNERLGPVLATASALPNGSGAPSANGSQASASPRRTTRQR